VQTSCRRSPAKGSTGPGALFAPPCRVTPPSSPNPKSSGSTGAAAAARGPYVTQPRIPTPLRCGDPSDRRDPANPLNAVVARQQQRGRGAMWCLCLKPGALSPCSSANIGAQALALTACFMQAFICRSRAHYARSCPGAGAAEPPDSSGAELGAAWAETIGAKNMSSMKGWPEFCPVAGPFTAAELCVG
jgi:hypothetical protein